MGLLHDQLPNSYRYDWLASPGQDLCVQETHTLPQLDWGAHQRYVRVIHSWGMGMIRSWASQASGRLSLLDIEVIRCSWQKYWLLPDLFTDVFSPGLVPRECL